MAKFYKKCVIRCNYTMYYIFDAIILTISHYFVQMYYIVKMLKYYQLIIIDYRI